MSEDYKVKWEDVKRIYNDRKLNGIAIVRRLRELYDIEFFREMIEINKTELEGRLKSYEYYKKQSEEKEGLINVK